MRFLDIADVLLDNDNGLSTMLNTENGYDIMLTTDNEYSNAQSTKTRTHLTLYYLGNKIYDSIFSEQEHNSAMGLTAIETTHKVSMFHILAVKSVQHEITKVINAHMKHSRRSAMEF